MKNLFSFDSPIFSFLSKVCDLVVLNILWLFFCLPVFTIGASTAALYRCIEKLQKDGAIKIVREFWKNFRVEFKQGTALFGILLLVVAILAADIWIILFSGIHTGLVGPIIMCVLFFLTFPAICYVYPLQAHFVNNVFTTLKNAWLMALSHFPVSIVVVLLHLLPVLLMYFFPTVFYRTFIIWLLIGGSLIAYISMLLLRKVFKKYEPTEAQ